MIELPEQRLARRGRDFVDPALLGDKQSAKAFRSAAYTLGISVAFLIISSVMPSYEDRRVGEMLELIGSMALWMIFYAAIVIFAYIKMRANMKYVLFMLNWFLVPTIALWFILRVMDIYSNIPPELQP